MDAEKYFSFLESIKKADKILIVSHVNADVDAISSASLLKSLISNVNPEAQVEYLFPNGVSTKAKNVLEYLKLSYRQNISETIHPNLVIFIDVGSEGVLGEAKAFLEEEKCRKILIDHHLQNQDFLKKFDLHHIEEKFSSTCEIIYSILKEMGVKVDERNLYALATGILVESRFLINAKCETYNVIRELCRIGVDLRRALSLLRRTRSFSEKVAVLKAFKRMEVYRAGDWLFIFVKLSAYRSEAASQIIALGVDFVAAGNNLKGRCNIHVKISKRFLDTFRIDAGGKLVSLIRDEFKGVGGGHSQVATIVAETDLESVFKFLVDFLSREVEKIGLKLTRIDV